MFKRWSLRSYSCKFKLCRLGQLFLDLWIYSLGHRSNLICSRFLKYLMHFSFISAGYNTARKVSLAKVNPRLHLQFLCNINQSSREEYWDNFMTTLLKINYFWFLNGKTKNLKNQCENNNFKKKGMSYSYSMWKINYVNNFCLFWHISCLL